MIASLPMYDFPSIASANAAFWEAVRDPLRSEGIAAPESLLQGGDLREIWRNPTLLFGQTCGYPYWFGLRDAVEIVAAPLYAFEGCEGPNHCSFLVVRENDPRETLAAFRGARAAVNSQDSNSGMNLFRAAVAPVAGGRPFFGKVSQTGAHALSLKAVAEGEADIAAIDCVSYALVSRSGARSPGVRILDRTPSAPALPFIASRAMPAKTLAALRAALAGAADQPALGLRGVADTPASAYARIAALESQAVAQGYPMLA